MENTPTILGHFPYPGVRLHALGRNALQSAAMAKMRFVREQSNLACASICGGSQRFASEIAVNRLVAGSNPARGAKQFKRLANRDLN
jgi:hypothetical protein